MATQTTPGGNIAFTTAAELADPAKDLQRAINRDARDREVQATAAGAATDAATALTTLGAVKQEAIAAKSAAQQSASSSSSSAAAANAAADAAERFGDDVQLLKQMAQISPGTVTDAQTALLIQDQESETHARLKAQSVQARAADLRMFRPEDYGAKGDGVTDDTMAVQAAVDAARNAGGGVVYLNFAAVYVVTKLDVQAGLTIEGNLARFFRPANTPNWTRMVSNSARKYSGDTDSVRPITARNLVLDGNLVNQGAYQNWEQEQSSLMFFNGDITRKGREYVVLDNIFTVGSVSDGVHIVANVRAEIGTLTAIDCFRGGLTLTGGNSSTNVQRYHGSGAICGAHIDMEFDSPAFGGSLRHDFTVEGSATVRRDTPNTMPTQIESRDGALVSINNPNFETGLYLAMNSQKARGSVTFTGGRIHTLSEKVGAPVHDPQPNQMINPEDVTFTGCTIIVNNIGDAVATVRAFDIRWNFNGAGIGSGRLRFRNCDFLVGRKVAGDNITAVYSRGDTGPDNWVIIEGGSVSADYDMFYRQLLGGRLRAGGGIRVGAKRGFYANGSASQGYPYVLEMGDIVPESTCTEYLFMENSGPTFTVTHKGTVVDQAQNNLGTTSGLANNTYRGSRTIRVTAAPTGATDGLTGDIAQLAAPVPGQPYQWVCTTPNSNGLATWKPLTTVAA